MRDSQPLKPFRLMRDAGQGLVEFALVLPIIMLLIFGAVDLGRAVYAYNTIANAARDGARVAAVNQIATSPDCNEDRPVENPATPHWSIKRCAADAALTIGVRDADVAVTFSAPSGTSLPCTSSNLNVGCIASVTVSYTYTPITPVIGGLVGNIAINSTSQMPIERVFP
jgi:Flp pilus assembly protein TadG